MKAEEAGAVQAGEGNSSWRPHNCLPISEGSQRGTFPKELW